MRKIKIVATAAFAKAPPGGSTVMLASNSFLINPALDLKLPCDTVRDFVPITVIATQPVALVIGITSRELRCHGIFSAR